MFMRGVLFAVVTAVLSATAVAQSALTLSGSSTPVGGTLTVPPGSYTTLTIRDVNYKKVLVDRGVSATHLFFDAAGQHESSQIVVRGGTFGLITVDKMLGGNVSITAPTTVTNGDVTFVDLTDIWGFDVTGLVVSNGGLMFTNELRTVLNANATFDNVKITNVGKSSTARGIYFTRDIERVGFFSVKNAEIQVESSGTAYGIFMNEDTEESRHFLLEDTVINVTSTGSSAIAFSFSDRYETPLLEITLTSILASGSSGTSALSFGGTLSSRNQIVMVDSTIKARSSRNHAYVAYFHRTISGAGSALSMVRCVLHADTEGGLGDAYVASSSQNMSPEFLNVSATTITASAQRAAYLLRADESYNSAITLSDSMFNATAVTNNAQVLTFSGTSNSLSDSSLAISNVTAVVQARVFGAVLQGGGWLARATVTITDSSFAVETKTSSAHALSFKAVTNTALKLKNTNISAYTESSHGAYVGSFSSGTNGVVASKTTIAVSGGTLNATSSSSNAVVLRFGGWSSLEAVHVTDSATVTATAHNNAYVLRFSSDARGTDIVVSHSTLTATTTNTDTAFALCLGGRLQPGATGSPAGFTIKSSRVIATAARNYACAASLTGGRMESAPLVLSGSTVQATCATGSAYALYFSELRDISKMKLRWLTAKATTYNAASALRIQLWSASNASLTPLVAHDVRATATGTGGHGNAFSVVSSSSTPFSRVELRRVTVVASGTSTQALSLHKADTVFMDTVRCTTTGGHVRADLAGDFKSMTLRNVDMIANGTTAALMSISSLTHGSLEITKSSFDIGVSSHSSTIIFPQLGTVQNSTITIDETSFFFASPRATGNVFLRASSFDNVTLSIWRLMLQTSATTPNTTRLLEVQSRVKDTHQSFSEIRAAAGFTSSVFQYPTAQGNCSLCFNEVYFAPAVTPLNDTAFAPFAALGFTILDSEKCVRPGTRTATPHLEVTPTVKRSISTTLIPQTPAPETPTPDSPVVSAPVTVVTTTTTSVAGVASPSAALGAQRARLVFGSPCATSAPDGSKNLPFVEHPMRFAIGTGPARYFLGSLIGTLVLFAMCMVIVIALIVLTTILRFHQKQRDDAWEAGKGVYMLRLFLQGFGGEVLMILTLLLLTPATTAGIICLLHPSSEVAGGVRFAGAFGLLVVIGAAAALTVFSVFFTRKYCFGRDEPLDDDDGANGANEATADKYLGESATGRRKTIEVKQFGHSITSGSGMATGKSGSDSARGHDASLAKSASLSSQPRSARSARSKSRSSYLVSPREGTTETEPPFAATAPHQHEMTGVGALPIPPIDCGRVRDANATSPANAEAENGNSVSTNDNGGENDLIVLQKNGNGEAAAGSAGDDDDSEEWVFEVLLERTKLETLFRRYIIGHEWETKPALAPLSLGAGDAVLVLIGDTRPSMEPLSRFTAFVDRIGCHWFFALDLWVALFTGVGTGLLQLGFCRGVPETVLAVQIVFIIVFVIMRPFRSPLLLCVAFVTMILQAVLVITAASTSAGMFGQGGGGGDNEALGIVATILSVFLAIQGIVGIVVGAIGMYQRHKDDARRQSILQHQLSMSTHPEDANANAENANGDGNNASAPVSARRMSRRGSRMSRRSSAVEPSPAAPAENTLWSILNRRQSLDSSPDSARQLSSRVRVRMPPRAKKTGKATGKFPHALELCKGSTFFTQTQLEEIFRALDVKGNGYLDPHEFYDFFCEAFLADSIGVQNAETKFQKSIEGMTGWDTGRLSFDEFYILMLKPAQW